MHRMLNKFFEARCVDCLEGKAMVMRYCRMLACQRFFVVRCIDCIGGFGGLCRLVYLLFCDFEGFIASTLLHGEVWWFCHVFIFIYH